MKFGLKHYWKPTPKNIRKLGDALFASFSFLAGSAAINNEKYLVIACLILAAIGRFLTDMFGEDNNG